MDMAAIGLGTGRLHAEKRVFEKAGMPVRGKIKFGIIE